jgi:GT2 family glycosyltransferase/SAM-dependent methyltransferase
MATLTASPATTLRPVAPAAPPTPLLRPADEFPADLDFDTGRRFGIAVDRLAKLLAGATGVVRILDVGCNVLNLFPKFFTDRVRITRCDTFENVAHDPHYVRIVPGEPLPFADEQFDAVVSLEVLEHIPPTGRGFFLKECLRVSKNGCVWSCPNGEADVKRAERAGSMAFERRNGKPHPFLSEHAEFGLPTEAEITGHLSAFDVPHAVFRQTPADVWLASLALGEPLAETGAPEWVKSSLTDVLTKLDDQLGEANRPACYRKIYVAAKTFDATDALSPLSGGCQPSVEGSHGGLTPSAREESLLPAVCTAAGQAVAGMAAGWRREVKLLEQEVGRHSSDRKRWAEESEALRRELSAWNQRAYLLTSDVSILTRSLSWKLAAPLRILQRWVKPESFTSVDLRPWFELKPTEPGGWMGPGTGPLPLEWESLGLDPQFVLPVMLPKGYVRIEMKLSGPTRALTELYADEGEGFTAGSCVESFEWEETLTVDICVKFDKPVFGLRLDPMGTPGIFHLHFLRVTPLAGPRILGHAIAKKLELLRMYRLTGTTFANGAKMLATGQFRRAFGKVMQTYADDRRLGPSSMASRTSYDVWRRRRELTPAERRRQSDVSNVWLNPPTISAIVPVYNPPPDCLEKAIQSVRQQTYPLWQLCLADDGSTDPRIAPILRKHAAADPRIVVSFAEKNGGISAASNRALDRATGDFIALFDHDDELAPHAFFKMAEAIRANPQADFFYSDEDKITMEGTHIDPFFKPDWSPDFFLSCMYTCHLGVYRRALVEKLGRFRSEFDTAQDYDLALRFVSTIQNDQRDGGLPESHRIVHVPDVLYHWRMLPGSTALTARAKPKAEETARRAVDSYLQRVNKPGRAERGSAVGLHRVRYEIQGRPKVSIVIPTAGRRCTIRGKETWYALHCVESIRKQTTYDHYEIVVVDNDDLHPQLARSLDALGVRRIPFTEPFNLSVKMNLGVAKSEGDYVILLNDDTEVQTPDWIEAMLEVGQWPEVGAVGAKLLFEDGRLQHAGVTFVDRVPLHHFYAAPGDYPGYWHGNLLIRNYSAVTGACVLVRTDDYHAVGGFDPEFPLNYNDIDMCLKLRRRGLRIVYQPHAILSHFESASKDGIFQEEIDRFVAKWGNEFACDPYYNPNLTKVHGDYRLGAGIDAVS